MLKSLRAAAAKLFMVEKLGMAESNDEMSTGRLFHRIPPQPSMESMVVRHGGISPCMMGH